jgi:hypothetical protein
MGTAAYQGTYALQHASDPSGLAVDAVVAPGENHVLFVTSEFSAGVEVVDPVTLTYMGVSSGPSGLVDVDIDDVTDVFALIGCAVDDLIGCLYVTRYSGGDDLQVYDCRSVSSESGGISFESVGRGESNPVSGHSTATTSCRCRQRLPIRSAISSAVAGVASRKNR